MYLGLLKVDANIHIYRELLDIYNYSAHVLCLGKCPTAEIGFGSNFNLLRKNDDAL